MTDHPAVLALSGELDIATAATAISTAAAGLSFREGQRVLVDVSRVVFIDAAGLGALVGLRNEISARGGATEIVYANDRFRRTCAVAGLAGLVRPR